MEWWEKRRKPKRPKALKGKLCDYEIQYDSRDKLFYVNGPNISLGDDAKYLRKLGRWLLRVADWMEVKNK